MPIYDRNLRPGTVLVASGKYAGRTCNVEMRNGKAAFVLDTGAVFSSPSAAGGEVTASACNGWKFWSVEGEAQPAREERTAGPTRNEKRARQREAALRNVSIPATPQGRAPATQRKDMDICVDCEVNVKERGDTHWHDSHQEYTPEGLKAGTVCCPCARVRGYNCGQEDAVARLARESRSDLDFSTTARSGAAKRRESKKRARR